MGGACPSCPAQTNLQNYTRATRRPGCHLKISPARQREGTCRRSPMWMPLPECRNLQRGRWLSWGCALLACFTPSEHDALEKHLRSSRSAVSHRRKKSRLCRYSTSVQTSVPNRRAGRTASPRRCSLGWLQRPKRRLWLPFLQASSLHRLRSERSVPGARHFFINLQAGLLRAAAAACSSRAVTLSFRGSGKSRRVLAFGVIPNSAHHRTRDSRYWRPS
jgi:hypothetical protein